MSNFPEFDRYNYRIESELGHNRAGGRITYLATDIRTQHQVVIKQFQFAKSGSTWSDYDSYDREIQVLRGLNHPGIPRYLDSFHTEDGFCMVQEYKQALSLGEPRSFNPYEVKQVAVALLEILVYLQNRIPSVIHRDIKPENILIDKEMNVYLVDFGFARIGDGEVGISSVVKGTLGFMPPEQLFNRQLTEASDLYGLGITLICLLTGTKSTEIGNLIDITYRINFKHLVPKISIRWINWLEKMVEPRLKDRFPNASAALAALPTNLIYLPEAIFSQSSLEFVASGQGEKLTQMITIHNPIPDTMLEGIWEVAPHPSDPPHTPDFHSWISLQPNKFEANQVNCYISVDTNKLMLGQTYNRKILLHTNCLSKNYSLNIQVKTAPIPLKRKKLPYVFLGLLFLLSLALAWIISVIVFVTGTMAGAVATAGFGAGAGIAVGFEAAAWVMATAGATGGAMAGSMAGIIVGILSLLMAWSGVVAAAGTAVLSSAIAGLVGGAISGVGTGIVVEDLLRKGIGQNFAVCISLLTTASGISLGLSFVLGLLNPLVIFALLGTSLPLLAMILYPYLRWAKVISDYRKAEENLVKP